MKQDLPAMTVAENLGTYEHRSLTFINIYSQAVANGEMKF